MKKIFLLLLLLFLNVIIGFLDCMDADVPREISLQTVEGKSVTFPFSLARYSSILSRNLANHNIVHTVSQETEIAHIDCLKNMLTIIDKSKQDETTLLDRLREEFNTFQFDSEHKNTLVRLVEELNITITKRPHLLEKMFAYIKIESNDGERSLYVNTQRLKRSSVLSALIEFHTGSELPTEGIPFALFDSAMLLFDGDITQENKLRKVVECLYNADKFCMRKEKDLCLDQIIQLITKGTYNNSETLCEQFECLKADQKCGELLALEILQRLKDIFAFTPLSQGNQSMFEYVQEGDDTFAITAGTERDFSFGYYSGIANTILITNQSTGSTIMAPYSICVRCISMDKKCVFIFNKDGSSVLLYYLPENEGEVTRVGFDKIPLEIDDTCSCSLSKDNKYIKIDNLKGKSIVINLELYIASSLKEGLYIVMKEINKEASK